MNKITAKDADRLLDGLVEIVSRASALILSVPAAKVAQRVKPDRTPVTAADEASQQIIVEGLAKLLPGVPIVAEEQADRPPLPSGIDFVIVDPLDGTKEFLAGRDEYTVNIALISGGVPVIGVIAAPAQGLLWRGGGDSKAERMRLRWGDGVTRAAERCVVHARPAPARLVAITSRTHLDAGTKAYLQRLPVAQHQLCGSSVKFCRLAQGDADVYPRLSPTREWDVAAGCAILTAAGGSVTDPQGQALGFGRAAQGFEVPGFIAWGDGTRATAN